jgi:hypothetical protein
VCLNPIRFVFLGFFKLNLCSSVKDLDLDHIDFEKIESETPLEEPSKLDKFLEGLSKINKSSPVVLSGQIVRDYKGQVASNISIKRSLGETIQFLNTI